MQLTTTYVETTSAYELYAKSDEIVSGGPSPGNFFVFLIFWITFLGSHYISLILTSPSSWSGYLARSWIHMLCFCLGFLLIFGSMFYLKVFYILSVTTPALAFHYAFPTLRPISWFGFVVIHGLIVCLSSWVHDHVQKRFQRTYPGADPRPARKLAKRFKQTFSRQDACVHFVGVWLVFIPLNEHSLSYFDAGILFPLLAFSGIKTCL